MVISRRDFMGLAATAAAAPLLVRSVLAAAPQAGRQVPGVHRLRVGQAEITAINDGYLEFAPEVFPTASAEEINELLAAAFRPAGPWRGAVNAYAVNTGERLVLIDSGTATAFGPTLGKLPENLAAAGIDPAAVDVVLLTHMHPDHINGIVTGDGTAAFPNAELVVHQADWDFWTDESRTNAAPEAMRPFFLGAQKAVAPYAGRIRRVQGDGTEVAPGITLVELPGHTPGHCGFRVASDGAQMLIWGDIIHAPVLQFARPEWTVAFDVDAQTARATRARTLDMVAADRILVAGMHLDFPGFGHVVRDGDAYAFVPAPWWY